MNNTWKGRVVAGRVGWPEGWIGTIARCPRCDSSIPVRLNTCQGISCAPVQMHPLGWRRVGIGLAILSSSLSLSLSVCVHESVRYNAVERRGGGGGRDREIGRKREAQSGWREEERRELRSCSVIKRNIDSTPVYRVIHIHGGWRLCLFASVVPSAFSPYCRLSHLYHVSLSASRSFHLFISRSSSRISRLLSHRHFVSSALASSFSVSIPACRRLPVSACTKRTCERGASARVTLPASPCTSRQPALSARADYASDAYYATADRGLCHDLDQTICSGRPMCAR